jgi:hypothetical protein
VGIGEKRGEERRLGARRLGFLTAGSSFYTAR